jgi:hypothetical protein
MPDGKIYSLRGTLFLRNRASSGIRRPMRRDGKNQWWSLKSSEKETYEKEALGFIILIETFCLVLNHFGFQRLDNGKCPPPFPCAFEN